METPADVLSDLCERVSAAHRESRPLLLRGTGTKDFYGETLPGDLLQSTPRATQIPTMESLDLRTYRGIVDYEPSELVITARCGGAPTSQSAQ